MSNCMSQKIMDVIDYEYLTSVSKVVPGCYLLVYKSQSTYATDHYPFPNFNDAAVAVWKWRSDFIPHFTGNYLHSCHSHHITTRLLPNLNPWWRHQMETFSALLALCAGNSPATGEFSAQRPVTESFDVFFDLRLNKRLSKQSRGWWLEMPSRSL